MILVFPAGERVDGWMERSRRLTGHLVERPYSYSSYMALTAAFSLEKRGPMAATTGEPVPSDHAAGWPPLNLRLNPGCCRSERQDL